MTDRDTSHVARVAVSIIIVNWNSREYLRKCLASIRANPPELAVEIIVIDSASFDGAEQLVRDCYPEVRFIQSSTNLGFARANNTAFEQASGDCVMFLNPDTEVEGCAIGAMHSRLQALPMAGIVGARLMNSDGSVQTSCIRTLPTVANRILDCDLFRALWPTCPLWGMAPLFDRSHRVVHEVEAVSGACMMTKRETFQRVGGFSEDYFMYGEDMDLSYKVRQAGLKNYYVSSAVVVHHGGSSSGQAENRFAAVMIPEANWRFLKKTRGSAYGLCYRVTMLASAVARIAALQVLRLFYASRSGSRDLAVSTGKWRAVLRWSLNRDDLVKEYYRNHLKPHVPRSAAR